MHLLRDDRALTKRESETEGEAGVNIDAGHVRVSGKSFWIQNCLLTGTNLRFKVSNGHIFYLPFEVSLTWLTTEMMRFW